MQYCLVNRKLAKVSLLLISLGTSFPVVSQLFQSDAYAANQAAAYSDKLVAQRNPWALPPKPQENEEFRHFPEYRQQQSGQNQPYTGGEYQPSAQRYQSGRFVTPETLEMLKRQQTMTQQVAPAQPQRRGYRNVPSLPYGYGVTPSLPAYFSMPPYGGYGAGISNPFYDVPEISPWGNGSDVLLGGGLVPDPSALVPAEALGGLPPINIPLFPENPLSQNSDDNGTAQDTGNTFQPFSFMPENGGR